MRHLLVSCQGCEQYRVSVEKVNGFYDHSSDRGCSCGEWAVYCWDYCDFGVFLGWDWEEVA